METAPLLRPPLGIAGVLDYKGRPITKPGSGRWVAVSFILGMEIAERVAYNGIMFNLISYMTGPLGESTASAAASVTLWSGATMVLPILGALVSDTILSRYRTIVISSLLYILGLGLLAISAMLPNRSDCSREHVSCPPTTFKVVLFYFSLYLVAFAEGGHRPCVQAFGADQFDETDREESMLRSSFFNLWVFGLSIALTASPIILSYLQENVNWSLGFGIHCFLLGAGLIVFLIGSSFYRCYPLRETSSYAQLWLKRQLFSGAESEAEAPNNNYGDTSNQPILQAGGKNIEAEETEEAKWLLRLFPIWATCLAYSVVLSQWETFFTKQGATLDRKIGSSFKVPAAGFQSVTNVTMTFMIVAYDRVAVPLARNITGIPSGITKLQRIGTGLLISVFVMVISALVETKRLETAREFGLLDEPSLVLPMSIVWLFPQYILVGISFTFTTVGLQEFFYDQVPDDLRSLGIALCFSIFGIGHFINSFFVYVIDKATRSINGESWFSDNLNRAHLDYFYWLIACVNFCSFILFLHFARYYVYEKKREIGV